MDLLMTIPLFVTLAKMTRHRGFHRWATTLALFAGILARYALVLIPPSEAAAAPEALSPVPRSRSSSSSSWVSIVFYAGPHHGPPRARRVGGRRPGGVLRSWPNFSASGWCRCRQFAEGADGEGVAPPDVLADNSWSNASVFTLREPQMSNFRFDLMGESHSTLPLPGSGTL